LFCQAISAGVDPRSFGDYTYSQLVAFVDASKLAAYNERYYDVIGIVSNMSDEGVRDALFERSSGNPARAKLIARMMVPYSPSFLRREFAEVRAARPVDGLDSGVAEGIMRAIELRLLSDEQWLVIYPSWQRILASASKFKP
jgi:hypothetical protein